MGANPSVFLFICDTFHKLEFIQFPFLEKRNHPCAEQVPNHQLPIHLIVFQTPAQPFHITLYLQLKQLRLLVLYTHIFSFEDTSMQIPICQFVLVEIISYPITKNKPPVLHPLTVWIFAVRMKQTKASALLWRLSLGFAVALRPTPLPTTPKEQYLFINFVYGIALSPTIC